MASLHSTYPIMFDTTELISPSQWEESSEVVEGAVGRSEAGTDTVDVSRYDKLTISVQFKVAEATNFGTWAKILKSFSKQPSINVKRYDILAEDYETRVMRIREFRANLVPKTDLLPSIKGVWEINFKLIEF